MKKKGTRKVINGYIIKGVSKTGTILSCSEMMETVTCVKNYLSLMDILWNNGEEKVIPADYTKEQKFTDQGLALPGI